MPPPIASTSGNVGDGSDFIIDAGTGANHVCRAGVEKFYLVGPLRWASCTISTLPSANLDDSTGVANARPPRVPRNSAEGPGYADLDLRRSRDLFLDPAKKADGRTLTFGVDVFNVLDRVNYIGTLTSPFFGRAVAAQPPRRLQLSLRVRF